MNSRNCKKPLIINAQTVCATQVRHSVSLTSLRSAARRSPLGVGLSRAAETNLPPSPRWGCGGRLAPRSPSAGESPGRRPRRPGGSRRGRSLGGARPPCSTPGTRTVSETGLLNPPASATTSMCGPESCRTPSCAKPDQQTKWQPVARKRVVHRIDRGAVPGGSCRGQDDLISGGSHRNLCQSPGSCTLFRPIRIELVADPAYVGTAERGLLAPMSATAAPTHPSLLNHASQAGPQAKARKPRPGPLGGTPSTVSSARDGRLSPGVTGCQADRGQR